MTYFISYFKFLFSVSWRIVLLSLIAAVIIGVVLGMLMASAPQPNMFLEMTAGICGTFAVFIISVFTIYDQAKIRILSN